MMRANLPFRMAAALLLILALGGFRSATSLFAPSIEPWPKWEKHDPTSTAAIDYAAWDALLQRYVKDGPDGLAVFDYGAVTAADKQALKDLIEAMEGVAISNHARPQQMSYWINLYNAVTVDVVLDHYPVKSIRDIDISPGFFADGPWGKKLVTVEGEELSLNEIEHRILRPVWKDARVHYAVNCASVGCPNLAMQAYVAESLDNQLDAAARDYINNPRGITVKDGKITVSSIYDWFYDDFGGSDAALMAHLKKYAEPDLARQLDAIGQIEDTQYDWTLNDAR